ncbi:epoxide hydrolase family protein [Actinomadura sp. DC4]|uniref:epoxide hydrolase family protein n=1 Tax=Actinomadura sp. DC4 TaxID=3055069 RepID=UPI0025B1D452|nr:epoxide hydrolase family protein [Actinomadura sp. DC4]MDN3352974.1 epoxide hydrolase [Actinomadura sp. DC4]
MDPYRIDIPQADLDDLRERLSRTRWPDAWPGWSYGIPVERVRSLVDHWRTGYDWREHEAALNAFPQFTTEIDGQNVHFLHVRSQEPFAMPLILSHGWPSTVADLLPVIGPLTDPRAYGGDPADAFHVVAPSLPGYGFSGPTSEAGWDVTRIARAWAVLMDRLGYASYGAQGGDWGARISPELGRVDPSRVVGVHVNALVALPTGDPSELEGLTPVELERMSALGRWHEERSGYAQIQSTRPQTLAYGLADSPVGQLAWYTEWFDDYGENVGGIDRDAILTNVSAYWLTGTAASAARLYREAAGSWGRAERSPVPLGVAVFPGDSTVRRLASRDHAVAHWSEFDRGGHFASLQAPDLLVGDVRDFFRKLR